MREVSTISGAEKKFRAHIKREFPQFSFLSWQEAPHIVKAFRADGIPATQYGAAARLKPKDNRKQSAPKDSTHRARKVRKETIMLIRLSLVGARLKSSKPRKTNGSWVDKRSGAEIFSRRAIN